MTMITLYVVYRLHDRKICVLGLCALMATSADRSSAITAVSEQILPSCVLLFSGLQRAYASTLPCTIVFLSSIQQS